MGSIVSDGCVPQGGTRTEYFLSGSAPTANCYPPGYAWGDTTGWYDTTYDSLRGTLPTTAEDSAWWERLRLRTFGRDTLSPVPPDTTGATPGGAIPLPGQRPPDTITRPPITIPRRPDTTRIGARPRPTGEPIGRPVGRPRTDTIPR
jgi:hypothetical protein